MPSRPLTAVLSALALVVALLVPIAADRVGAEDYEKPTGWATTSAGAVTALGGAPHLGDVSGVALAAAVVDLDATKSGNGYWLVAADGGVFTFGDAG